LRRLLESAQYTSFDFTQALADNDVLGSLGSTGDAYDTQSRLSVSASPAWA
jgi:hypothetical protein